MSIGEAERIRQEVVQDREQSLQDPEGVRYVDQLWDLIKDEPDLPVVMRLPGDAPERFADVPVAAHWSHGRYDWQEADQPEHSGLTFLVPDVITLCVQSDHAADARRRFFGHTGGVALGSPFLPSNPPELDTATPGASEEFIVDNFERLKTAVEMTAENRGGHLGGQAITATGPSKQYVARARVAADRLEICLSEDAITDMKTLWAQAFRREVLLEDVKR